MGDSAFCVVVAGIEGVGVSTLARYLIDTLPPDVAVTEVVVAAGDAVVPPVNADAMLYVCAPVPQREDARVVAALAGDAGDSGRTQMLGVVGRADLLDFTPGAPQSLSAAAARPHADSVQSVLTIGVVPVSALLAQAARTLTVGDVEVLRRVASVTNAAEGGHQEGIWWYSAGLFLAHATYIAREDRERLLELLDLPGIALAVHALRANPRMTLDKMGELMREASGIAAVDTWVRGALWNAAAVRAGAARVSLEKRIVQELHAGAGRAAAGVHLLRRSAVIAVPWSIEQVMNSGVTLRNLFEWAALARREAARARTAQGAHAALARYRHFLAVAEQLMTEGSAA